MTTQTTTKLPSHALNSNPNHDSSSSSDPLTQATSLLTPALHLLERFHHRNKNQHRTSKWWAQADMLRRHVRKMLDDLDQAAEEREQQKKRREREERRRLKKGTSSTDKGEQEGEGKAMGMVRKRAGYLRGGLGPGAFVAFTQLTADRQFAHLGLMMLGVLAQVNKAVEPFAPGPSSVEEYSTGQAVGTVEAAPLINQGVGHVLGGDELGTAVSREQLEMEWEGLGQEQGVDMGEVVSREEVERMVASVEVGGSATSKPISQAPGDDPDEKPAQTASKDIKKVNPNKRKALPLLSPSTGTTSAEPEANPPEPKEKPAASGGDEFDSIFGSLERKENKKKKEKPLSKLGTGDEFDSISSGLEKKKKDKPILNAGGNDEFDNIFEGLGKKKAKLVTVHGAGDEFDDIFGGLEKKKKKNVESSSKLGGLDKGKIKKKKKKDEFDDIFGGLL